MARGARAAVLCSCLLVLACSDAERREQAQELLQAGDAHMRRQEYTRAVAAYGQASDLLPDDAEPLRKSAMALVILRRDEGAIANFEGVVERGEELSGSELVFWATALQRQGRIDEALAKYDEALATDPTNTSAMNNLGVLLMSRDGERERGLALLEQAVRSKPGDSNVVYNLGRAYQQVGRHEEAYNLIQRAVAATPPNDPARAQRLARLRESEAHLGREPAPAEAPNVLVVVLDTLRADHVGTYGYPRPTTPELDALAAEGVVFETAISQAPWTAASIGTLFTGLHPSVHGLDGGIQWGGGRTAAGGTLPFGVQKVLSPSQRTLAEILRRNGYATAGFVSNIYVHSIFGFAQGFEVYDDEHRDYSRDVTKVKRRAERTNARVFEWIEQGPPEPFFLFVHYNDPHWPYMPPSPYGAQYVKDYAGSVKPEDTTRVLNAVVTEGTPLDPADLEYLIGLYDGEIEYADAHLGRLREKLASKPWKRPLLTVITADHGEEFMDHGSMSHGFTLYEEQLRVPLIVHHPAALSARRIESPVRLLDVTPTVLDLVGLSDEIRDFQGVSLRGLLSGTTPEAPGEAFSESTHLGNWKSLRTPSGVKWIQDLPDGPELLFDLSDDPREQRNLAARDAERASALRERLARRVEANRTLRAELNPGDGGVGEVVLDEATQEQLRSLGYIH